MLQLQTHIFYLLNKVYPQHYFLRPKISRLLSIVIMLYLDMLSLHLIFLTKTLTLI